jgi:O-antigen/teichoic acid export membrane protein
MSVRHAAVWAMASQYGAFIIQFATSVIISRFFLAPDEVGLFSIALAAAMLVAVLQDFGLSRYISGLPSLTAQEVNRCSSVAFIFSLLITLAIAALAWPLAQFYRLEQLAPLLLIIAGSYLFLPLSVVPMALMGWRGWAIHRLRWPGRCWHQGLRAV